jgi:hypothetical protein
MLLFFGRLKVKVSTCKNKYLKVNYLTAKKAETLSWQKKIEV